MKRILTALTCGLLFGIGLSLTQMTNPNKVLDFFDVFGHWDISLLFAVMGALTVTLGTFWLIMKRSRPLLDDHFYTPTKAVVDAQLAIGAVIFGIGWGIGGYCPGPVVAGLGVGNPEAVVMLVSIYSGFAVHRIIEVYLVKNNLSLKTIKRGLK